VRGLVAHPAWSPAFDLSAQWATFLASPPSVERREVDWMDVNEEYDGPDPVLRLAAQMTDMSEDCWCAGWLYGLERIVWGIVTGDGPDPIPGMRHCGMSEVTRDTLRRAIIDAGGAFMPWPYGVDNTPRLFASIPDVVAAYAALAKETP
jgi:hypothetical protein